MRRSLYGRKRDAERAERRRLWREAVLERDQWHCRMFDERCSGPLHAHHVRMRSQGGKDDLANGLTLCDWHHRYVHAHPTWSYEHGYLLRSTA